jgi:hypothetical protein
MSRTIKGFASAAAMMIALALGFVGHVSTPQAAPASGAPAAHAATAKAAEAKAALLKYLQNSKPGAPIVRRSGLHTGQKVARDTTRDAICVTNTCAYNWSGYASASTTKGEYTSVTATWKVPALTCTAEQELASQWVGLDGYSNTKTANNTVEQVGVLDWCFQGTAFYYTWWEMFPANSMTVGTTAKPGDVIVARVTRSGTSYTLALTDSTTTGNNISTKQSCTTCTNESAEWIDERPAYGTTGITPLADTASWGPYAASTIAGGVTDTIASAPGSTQISMIDSTATYYLNTVSALASTGKGFSVKWLNSY